MVQVHADMPVTQSVGRFGSDAGFPADPQVPLWVRARGDRRFPKGGGRSGWEGASPAGSFQLGVQPPQDLRGSFALQRDPVAARGFARIEQISRLQTAEMLKPGPV